MPLTPGARLGPYEILSPLGQGGMGEVWRARDARLGREVALKTLPDAFAADADRLARFEREAKLLASLNHPHIGAIYGFEQHGHARVLVLELVEGPTLAERLMQAQGPGLKAQGQSQPRGLPLHNALSIALQIAEALEAAHEAGIVHRDLKPGNIKLTRDGDVKVLDFGLAKMMTPGSGGDPLQPDETAVPTITAHAATRPGTILGTAAYMSPEQAVGANLDRRTDIWSFGAVLYEMLTGRRAFPGATAADSLTAVQRRDPDFSALPAATPARVAELVRRCLVKDPRERLRDIGDARIELRDAIGGAGTIDRPPAPRRSAGLLQAAVVLLAAAGGALAWSVLGADDTTRDAPPTRLDLSVPRGQEGIDTLASSPIGISPDGRTLVYATSTNEGRYLYRRSLDAFEPVRILGTEGADTPFFSFDGQWIGFHADGQLKKVPLTGGEAIALAPVRAFLLGASWGPDDTIVFSDAGSGGLWQVSADGGEPERLTNPLVAQTFGHRFPYQLPNGRGVLFGIGGVDAPSRLAFLPAGSGEWRDVWTGADRVSAIRYLPTGHLVFGTGGTIYAGLFDPERVELTADPIPLVPDVASSPTSQYVSFAVSDTGTLVYVPASVGLSSGQLVRIAPGGRGSNVEVIGDISGAIFDGGARVSPVGDRFAVTTRTAGVMDVWSYGLERGDRMAVTQGAEAGRFVWRPDGRFLTVAMGADLYTVPADGRGDAELLLERDGIQTPLSWSGDGRLLLFTEAGPGTGPDLYVFSAADGSVTPVARTRAAEFDGALSSDGRLVAYVSDSTGSLQVYLEPLAGPGQRTIVSVDGADTPRWSADGSALFYRRGDTLMRVTVSADPVGLGTAEPFTTAPPGVSFAAGYGVAADGAVLAVRNPIGAGELTEVRIVLSWFEDLMERVPSGN